MHHHIDDSFVNQLFAHPTFQQKLKKYQQASNSSAAKKQDPPSVPLLVQQICSILSAQYKQRVDDQCLSIYKSHLQIIKEIQAIKMTLSLSSPHKTAASPYRDKNSNYSILSQVQLDQEGDPSKMRKNLQEIRMKGSSSFMSSFLCQSEIKYEDKQELQDRINATILNLSGDVAKFESSVDERLKNVENSLNRKMQSIYKTLTSVFENINDLQAKLNDSKLKEPRNGKESNPDKMIDLSLQQKLQTKERHPVQKEKQKQGEVVGRRRSFLGFLKY